MSKIVLSIGNRILKKFQEFCISDMYAKVVERQIAIFFCFVYVINIFVSLVEEKCGDKKLVFIHLQLKTTSFKDFRMLLINRHEKT